MRVIRSSQVTMNPRAQCLGTESAGIASDCTSAWGNSRSTLVSVKEHIRANPTHVVSVVHEIHSIYEANR